MKFEKTPRNVDFLTSLLIERKLVIKNLEKVKSLLMHIGYYRLSGYMLPFQLSNGSHQFREGIDFDLIHEHYLFGKKLRHLILDICERIEVSIKANICNEMAMKYGSHWYINAALFYDANLHHDLLNEITESCKGSDEKFIKSYRNKYTDPEQPAIWMIMETLTFGQMSRLYDNLVDNDEKKGIATKYNAVPNLFASWLKSINFVRNCCAHHARLWNRAIIIKPTIPQRERFKFLSDINEDTNKRLYGTLSCMLYLVKQINPKTTITNKFKKLFDEHPNVNTNEIGFPKNWMTENLWKFEV